MRSAFVALLLLAPVTVATSLSLGACKSEPALKDSVDAKFRVGQRWSYWARPGEEQSTFTIEKIETHAQLGVIVHVGLDNLRLQRGKKTEGIVPHLAFSRDAIEKSATKMVEDNAGIPPYAKEYEAWKKQVEDGKGQVIQTTIAEQLTSMEDK
jgi:hypothetical protein